MDNNFSMKVLANLKNDSFIRGTICAFVSLINPSIDFIDDIKTSVSEAITNCIVHGYNHEVNNNYIELTVTIIDGNTIEISIKDNGIGIQDVQKAREPFFTTKKEEGRSGMGFTLMESFMDSVIIKSKINVGTEVIMRKKYCENNED